MPNCARQALSSINKAPFTDPLLCLLNISADFEYLHAVTPLHVTRYNETIDGLSTLPSAGADIHSQDGFRRTALHLAAQSGNAVHVKFLLEQGASPFYHDCNLQTPFMIA